MLPVDEAFGFAFLKTGYDSILPSFVTDLADNGVDTVHVAPIRLDPRVVDYIYRTSTHEHFYLNMKSHLTRIAVLAMVLEGREDASPQAIVNSLKSGKDGYPNLRTRYQRPEDIVSDEDFATWCEERHPDQDELTITLTQRNVFHAADDQEEAIETLSLIHDTNPGFYQENDSTNVPRLARLIGHFASFKLL